MPRSKRMGRTSRKSVEHKKNNWFNAFSKPVTIKSYHQKPFRIRHLGSLFVLFVALFALSVYAGRLWGKTEVKTGTLVVGQEQKKTSSVNLVRSSFGFSFAFDANVYDVGADAVDPDGKTSSVSRDKLGANQEIISVSLKPYAGAGAVTDSATRLMLEIEPDKRKLELFRANQPGGVTDVQIAANIFRPEQGAGFTVVEMSSDAEILNGIAVQKTVYKHIPNFDGGPVYSIVWSGVIDGRAFALQLRGLVTGSNIPAVYADIFNTLQFAGAMEVKGLTTAVPKVYAVDAVINERYRSDLVSPAVVKIYRLYCGNLIVEGADLLGNYCDAATGSGFFITSNGYIATNGHVVDVSAKAVFMDILATNENILSKYMTYKGYSQSQIRAALTPKEGAASIVAKVFSEPDTNIAFKNYEDTTIVALGDKALRITNYKDVGDLLDLQEDDNFKKAEIVATDYSAKDIYTIAYDDEAGFTASDVAILKIAIQNAPALSLATDLISQNQAVTVLGFPGDAENSLVSKDSLSVSVTNGTISSIRDAVGGSSKLYQTDADASQGNSGGPVIDESGRVIGLLTYRVQGNTSSGAGKSYIREINDLVKLAATKNINLEPQSSTQNAWAKGLELVSRSRYSLAVKEFERVKQDYPAHRLAASYIESSKKAIADGRDVKDFPIVLVAIVLFVVGLGGVSIVVFFIARHHGVHQVYKSGGIDNALSAPGELSQPAVVSAAQSDVPAPTNAAASPDNTASVATPTSTENSVEPDKTVQ